MKSRRSSTRESAPLGLECALPSRELRLAQTPAPARSPLWRRALNWVKTGFGRGPAAV